MARKILLIEDNLDDIALTRHALQKSGIEHALITIADGQEALDYLFHQGSYAALPSKERPDLIILDLGLPVLSGFDILQQLKANEQTRIIPVVVLTVSEAESDILRSYELGASSCVRKQDRIEAFEETIRDMMLYWFTFTKLPSHN